MRQIVSPVQASYPNYALHSLGWKSFQQLALAIAGEVFGQTVQGFFDSRDGGRDGAFYGYWVNEKGNIRNGSFTMQCKHMSDPSKVIKFQDLASEHKKAIKLVNKGLADNYFLFTSAKLTGENDEKIQKKFAQIAGLKSFQAYGVERISQMIHESPRLRMLVPRVYGLGDLSQIIDQRAYHQAREILSSLGDDLSKFVITNSYRNSVQALTNNGFVILLGEPACGKSTIAAALAMGALDLWKGEAVKVIEPRDVVTHFNPHESCQLFWIDDAFGATQFDWAATNSWNKIFPHINAAIKRGSKFIITSRDYIFNYALNVLKLSSLPVLNESRVVIKVEELSRDEKEFILYNHIKLGTQPHEFKKKIKLFLPRVVEHPRFSPEISRRLGNAFFTKKLHITKNAIDDFVEKPTEFLKEVIKTLDPASFAVIGLLFVHGGKLVSPLNITPDDDKILNLLGATRAEVAKAVQALNGSLVNLNISSGSCYWIFKHPTIQDAFASIVSEERELLDIYLKGTPLKQMFLEISCGNLELEGVKINIPKDRFEIILKRLAGFDLNKHTNKNSLFNFLSYRCDKEFLCEFMLRFPLLPQSFQIYSMIDFSPDVNLICRLNDFGMLPESYRSNYVNTIRKLTIETPDPGFLQENVKSLHTPSEYSETMNAVKKELIPNLDDVISAWEMNYSEEDDPDEHFGSLTNALDEFLNIYKPGDAEFSDIKGAQAKIEYIVEEKREEYSSQREIPMQVDNVPFDLTSCRSIFDDVDQ